MYHKVWPWCPWKVIIETSHIQAHVIISCIPQERIQLRHILTFYWTLRISHIWFTRPNKCLYSTSSNLKDKIQRSLIFEMLSEMSRVKAHNAVEKKTNRKSEQAVKRSSSKSLLFVPLYLRTLVSSKVNRSNSKLYFKRGWLIFNKIPVDYVVMFYTRSQTVFCRSSFIYIMI